MDAAVWEWIRSGWTIPSGWMRTSASIRKAETQRISAYWTG